MVVKGGKHRLVGFVDLGTLHEDMQTLEGNILQQNSDMYARGICKI